MKKWINYIRFCKFFTILNQIFRHFFDFKKQKMSILSPVSVCRPSSLKEFMPLREEVHKIYGVADFNNLGVQIPSSLYYHGIELYFEHDSIEYNMPRSTVISIIGIIKITISDYFSPHGDMDPSDPDKPALLVITHLADVFNQNTVNVITFTAIRSDLEKFKREVEAIIQKLKSGINISISTDNLHKKLRTRAQSFQIEALMNEQAMLRENKFIMSQESSIVSLPEIENIRLFLPKRFRLLPWKLLFSAAEHGVSFSTLYEKTDKKTALVLILLGKDGSRVGAFLPEGIQIRDGFYGNGETCVFHFNPYFAGFRWTQNNDLFLSCSKKDIIIGGGSQRSLDHGSAIYIDDNFMNCFTSQCKTFDSPPLANNESFKIIAVEVWHVHH
ncbi:TLD family protein [Trichomonas vaginalis G3]|uniref:Oxidation resistance protein 1 n=1 Tax=Trichomonas vaginalis (strain ATCC PRA-98 / G3) TaxID=412133 RepID=A2DVK7_TRIV3|nr:negative regulation of peptidyl-cysteine S-nitrosylation [Trichomonas vaginalis G3]EAY15549.1 TLD family protein [Trichomonas vaginalis G3]KAI5526195.1 negative regulation of peptidyl-cysteine S-nitrosylation [Trichomonas vaginalis G3]|eukprot:XP_001327772.1 TLD family protein [Trichomonas vaginalis G3]